MKHVDWTSLTVFAGAFLMAAAIPSLFIYKISWHGLAGRASELFPLFGG